MLVQTNIQSFPVEGQSKKKPFFYETFVTMYPTVNEIFRVFVTDALPLIDIIFKVFTNQTFFPRK